jgi:sulfite exporter TauE/SafE
MIEWPLVLLAGVLGSAHCVGMCGGFALTIGVGSPGLAANLVRQAAYTAGRLFTYGTLGLAAAYGGARLGQLAPALLNIPAALSLAAGGLLVYQGLVSTGLWSRRVIRGSSPCLAGTFLGPFLAAPGGTGAFLAGLFTGLLPCGLLYGMVTLAAATQDLLLGWTTMIVFGLGTAPLMLLAGCGVPLLSLAARRKLHWLAAWSVLATGAISVARGVAFLTLFGGAAHCPLCH